jgi:hypothetical protein
MIVEFEDVEDCWELNEVQKHLDRIATCDFILHDLSLWDDNALSGVLNEMSANFVYNGYPMTFILRPEGIQFYRNRVIKDLIK